MTPILLNGTQKDPLMGHSYLDRGGWGKRKEWVRIGQVKMSSAKRSGLSPSAVSISRAGECGWERRQTTMRLSLEYVNT